VCRLQLKLWPFCDIFPVLAKIWLPWQRPLDSCYQKCLIWIGRPLKPYPRTKYFVSGCYTSVVMSIRRFVTSLALRNREFSFFALNMENYLKILSNPKGPTLRENMYRYPVW